MYEWEDRRVVTRDCFVPWINRVRPLADATVIEFGCGTGSVGLALAPFCEKVVGVDIEAGPVSVANRKASELGITNATFDAMDFEACMARIKQERGRVDVFMLYAVLEHMTLDERLHVLSLADNVLRDDPDPRRAGVLVVCESPNRLLWGDYHTSKTPFNFQLPEEVSLRYNDRFSRMEYTNAIKKARVKSPADEHEAFVRWGRGISYHEFEIANMLDRIVATNFEPCLLPARHIHPEELMLAKYMEWHRAELPKLEAAQPPASDLAPCFSRYYLDLIIAKNRPASAPRHLRPWPLHTAASKGVFATRWDMLLIPDESAVLTIDAPLPTSRLVIAMESPQTLVHITLNLYHGHQLERHDFTLHPHPALLTQYWEVNTSQPATLFHVHASGPTRISAVLTE